MKRWLIGSLVFFVTLAVGLVTGWPIFNELRSVVVIPEPAAAPEIVVTDPVTTERASDDFVSEFRDLPNFEESEYKKPSGKLIDLLGDGVFRRSDLIAKKGEKWLVITKNGGFSITEHLAHVKKLNSITWPGEEKDAALTFPSLSEPPLIGIKDIRGIRPGPIKTVYFSNWATDNHTESVDAQMSTGYSRKFVLTGREFVLRTSLGITRDGSKVAVLVLETDSITQVVKQVPHLAGEVDIIGSLLWAGDIDRDGQLDLYFDEFNEKGYTAMELHLSSFAEKGKLVGLAADFGIAGC